MTLRNIQQQDNFPSAGGKHCCAFVGSLSFDEFRQFHRLSFSIDRSNKSSLSGTFDFLENLPHDNKTNGFDGSAKIKQEAKSIDRFEKDLSTISSLCHAFPAKRIPSQIVSRSNDC